MCLKTGDLDLDHQGQIGLPTYYCYMYMCINYTSLIPFKETILQCCMWGST